MRISDWSSDVCSSDLQRFGGVAPARPLRRRAPRRSGDPDLRRFLEQQRRCRIRAGGGRALSRSRKPDRSEEHTSQLHALMRLSQAVFALKTKKYKRTHNHSSHTQQITTTTYDSCISTTPKT